MRCLCSCLLTRIVPAQFERTLTKGFIFLRSYQEACPSDTRADTRCNVLAQGETKTDRPRLRS